MVPKEAQVHKSGQNGEVSPDVHHRCRRGAVTIPPPLTLSAAPHAPFQQPQILQVAAASDTPSSGSLRYTSSSGSLRYTPSSGSLRYTPSSGSLRYTPVSGSLIYTPVSGSLRYPGTSVRYRPLGSPWGTSNWSYVHVRVVPGPVHGGSAGHERGGTGVRARWVYWVGTTPPPPSTHRLVLPGPNPLPGR